MAGRYLIKQQYLQSWLFGVSRPLTSLLFSFGFRETFFERKSGPGDGVGWFTTSDLEQFTVKINLGEQWRTISILISCN